MQSNELQAVCDLSPVLTSIVQEFEGLVKQLWVYAQRNPQASFSALEENARQLRSECFASALQVAAELHRTQIEEEWLLGRVPCSCGCGGTPQYKGEQKRTIQTWVGSVTITRSYFYCKGCRTGRYPLDEALGIPGGEHFSEGVQQGVCLLGVQMGFDQASHALEMVSDICVSSKEAERTTEQRGFALQQSLKAEDQRLLQLSERDERPASAERTGLEGGLEGGWAVSLDAGKVRYRDGWHDAKAGVVFWAEPTLNEGGEKEGARATRQSHPSELHSRMRLNGRGRREAGC